MQRAHDFGEPFQLAIKWSGRFILRARGQRDAQ
jgi:hypothetical protein